MALLQLKKVTVAFGGPPVLDEIDLAIEPGEHLALLGRNGAGKSTLLRVLQGSLEPDGGEVIGASSVQVAYLDQQVPADLSGTILDVAMSAQDVSEHAARAAISRLGLEADAQVAEVSAGLKRRTLLARALATEPDLLLLDEPTNHLDVEAIRWLEEFLDPAQARTPLRDPRPRVPAGASPRASWTSTADTSPATRAGLRRATSTRKQLRARRGSRAATRLFDKRLSQEEDVDPPGRARAAQAQHGPRPCA